MGKRMIRLFFLTLFISISTSIFATAPKLNFKLLNPSKLTPSNPYIEVKKDDVEKIRIEKSKKPAPSIPRELSYDLFLARDGVHATIKGLVDFAELPYTVLPKPWIILKTSKNIQIEFNTSYRMFSKGEKRFELQAFYPINKNSNHWTHNIEIFTPSLGQATIKHAPDYDSVQLRTLNENKSAIEFINVTKDTSFALSGVKTLEFTAHLPLQVRDTPVRPDDKPKVTKSSKPLVFVKSQHSFEMGRKSCKYYMRSFVKISRNPIKELKLTLPPKFKLQRLTASKRHNLDKRTNPVKLSFHSKVRDQMVVELWGEFALTEETKNHHLLESAHAAFVDVEDERGFMAFYTKDIVKITEVEFKNPEILNRVDVTELPSNMVVDRQTPILWAFRYYEPTASFFVQTLNFAAVPLKKQLISKFHGISNFNPDLSAQNHWTFHVENQEKSTFTLPLPKGAKLKECKINNRSTRAFQDKDGNYSVELPKSSKGKNLSNSSIQFSQNSKNLSSLNTIRVDAIFPLSKQDKNISKIQIPLPPETQQITYQINPPKNKKINKVSSNFPKMKKAEFNLVTVLFDVFGWLPKIWGRSLEQNVFFIFFLLLLGSFILRTTVFSDILVPEKCGERYRAFLRLTLFCALLFVLWNLCMNQTIFEPHQTKTRSHSVVQGSFFPSQRNKAHFYVNNTQKNFSSPQGLKDGFFIDVDFNEPFTADKTLALIFLWLFPILAITVLLKNHYNGLFFIVIYHMVLQVLIQNLSLDISPTHLILAPLLALLAGLVMEGICWKKLLSASALVLLASTSTFASQSLDVYVLESEKDSIWYLHQNDYKNHFDKKKKENSKLVYPSQQRLKFYQNKELLLLEQTLTFPKNDGQRYVPIPVKQSLLQKFTASNKAIDKYKKNRNAYLVYNEASSIQATYLIHGKFPLNFKLRVHTGKSAINTLEFPKIKGFNVDTDSLCFQEQTKHIHQYHLAANLHFVINIKREQKAKAPKPDKPKVKTEVLEPDRFTISASHDYRLEENFMTGSSELELVKKGSPVKEFFIYLPKKLKIKSVNSSQSLADWFVDEKENILVLKYNEPKKGRITISIQNELKFKDKTGALGSFYAKGADSFQNIYSFKANENLSFLVKPNQKLLTTLKGDEYKNNQINPKFIQQLTKDIKPKEMEMNITTIPRQVVKSVSAFIDSIKAVSFLQKDGLLYTRYQFNIRNNGQQFLKLEFPTKESILTAKSNGEKIYLGKDGKNLLVPMKMLMDSKNDILPFLFECTTVREVENVDDFNLVIPSSSLSVATLKWTLSLFKPAQIESNKGLLVQDIKTSDIQFLQNEKSVTLKTLDEVPVDLPVFINQDNKSFHSYFISAKNDTVPSKIHVKAPFNEENTRLLGLFVGLIFWMMVWYRFKELLKPIPMLIFVIALMMLEQLFPLFFTPTLLAFVGFSLWLIPLAILRFSAGLRGMVKK
jgi:hypothetical protein